MVCSFSTIITTIKYHSHNITTDTISSPSSNWYFNSDATSTEPLELFRTELQILEYVVVLPGDMLGILLAVLRRVQQEHTVIVLTEGKATAKFFYMWAKANGILRTIHLVSTRASADERARGWQDDGPRDGRVKLSERINYFPSRDIEDYKEA